MTKSNDYLSLHIETVHSIQVEELTAALNSYAKQYQQFAIEEDLVSKGSDARLLVSSVSEGSIEISFIPELVAVGMTMLPIIDQGTVVLKFAEQLISLIRHFHPSAESNGKPDITIRDCDDVANIVSPVADNGGQQTIVVVNGGIHVNSARINQSEARIIRAKAERTRELLTVPSSETREAVSLTWHQLAKDAPKTQGKRSPDQGLIEELDDVPHAILFTDETAHLKGELIAEGENPYRMVYFVDVEVSRVGGKIVSYRLCGFHGKEELAA